MSKQSQIKELSAQLTAHNSLALDHRRQAREVALSKIESGLAVRMATGWNK